MLYLFTASWGGRIIVEKNEFSNQVRWYSFILCILVVLIHAQNTDIFIGQSSVVNGIESFVVEKIARTANAGFFLCSGYLFYRNFSLDRLGYKWKRRFFSIVLPFAVWNFFYYMIRLAVSKATVFGGYSDQEVIWSADEVIRAVVNCKYNQIFWFLQFLIVYTYICPLIYLMIRNRYIGFCMLTGVLLLAGGGYLNQLGEKLPAMANWLFLYMAGSYLGLHGKRWVEAPKKKAGTLLFSAAGAVSSHLLFAFCPGLTGQLLYYLFDAMLLWNLLGYMRLPEARWWMRDTFYIYAVHFMIVRVGNKLAYACLGSVRGMGLWMFVLLPVIVVIFCGFSGRLLKQYTPFVWKIMSGNR